MKGQGEQMSSTIWLTGTDGSKYRAFIEPERIDTSSFAGSSSIPGLKSARLEDGTPLNYVDENTFKNPVTGELLRRTS